MLPPIHFILFVINFGQVVLDFLEVDDEDTIPNIVLLTGLLNIVNILNFLVLNLDFILKDHSRENDIYKLIKLCDQYR